MPVRDRGVKGEIAALYPNVARKAGEPEPRDPRPEQIDRYNGEADCDQEAS